MTLPTDIYFPKPSDYKEGDDPRQYMNDMVFTLQNMYQQIAQVANGVFRNYADVDSSQWVPTLSGSVAGAFTYTSQYGWVRRSGIMTEIWFDVTWSATTATTNLYLDLPYLVTKSSGKPFVGTLQTATITYPAARTQTNCSAIPGTYRLEFWASGSGVATANIQVQAAGQVIGYCCYIGVSDD